MSTVSIAHKHSLFLWFFIADSVPHMTRPEECRAKTLPHQETFVKTNLIFAMSVFVTKTQAVSIIAPSIKGAVKVISTFLHCWEE